MQYQQRQTREISAPGEDLHFHENAITFCWFHATKKIKNEINY